MQIFLYEWITGGGLVEETGALPQSLLIEGSAMLTALATDFAALPDTHVTVLRDIRLDEFAVPAGRACNVIEIHSKSHHDDEVERLAAEAYHTLLIAPEIDRVLERCIKLARRAGGQVLAASDAFLTIASNKHQTAETLAAAGIPVPAGVVLDSDEEQLPADFSYPAVLKPVHGAGSQNTLLVSSPRDEPPPYPWPRRLEEFCAGIPASVSFLCGPSHRVPLNPCRQHLSTDGRFTYIGGSLLGEKDLAARARALAELALDALPGAHGYVGVDLVLGNDPDGLEDRVIEINPRVTTSYIGLRAATEANLAAAMLDVIAGREASPTFRFDPLEFSATGAVRRAAS